MIEEIINQENMSQGTTSEPGSKNLDMEAEYVYLPSKGVYYPEPYKGMDKLKVRKLNWEDEDILTTKSYYDNGTLFDEILKNCIVDENGFKASMLVPVDRDTILWWLRIGAFGKDYSIPWVCPGKKEDGDTCKHQHNETWDLGTFKMPELDPAIVNEILQSGGIAITLPHSLLKCKISIATVGREKEIERKLKLKKEKTKSTRDFLSTGKLISIIREVYDKEGKPLKTSEEILNWLRTGYEGKPLPLVDSRYIVRRSQEISLRVDTKKDIICPECDYIQEGVEMPMSIYFFWPEFEELSRVSSEKY